MRNRALCFGSYPDVYWSECTVASRQSYAEVPALLHGEWVGNGAVSFGVAGQGRTPSCLDRLATPVQVSVGFDGIYVSRVLGAGGKGLSGEAELRTEVNLQGQRQFVSFAEETGIAITRDDQSQQLYCMALRLDGGRMELSEWTRLRDGATHNPRFQGLVHEKFMHARAQQRKSLNRIGAALATLVAFSLAQSMGNSASAS
ncbi:hypothetical protein FNF29_07433 [Cafeteria roenbergensis]|nr:hypothetical protein FNF29_07433 [Cafeteria roenbergensis]|eukprot:KAA0147365.1 hypothetical protein FNF29_07433 [Cafeteria roenbergensis]